MNNLEKDHDFIQWKEENKLLKELSPFERNPRTITESQFDKLKQSIVQDGYHTRIKATPDGRIIGGHQRLKALKALGFTEVSVLVPDRDIDDEAFVRMCLRDNHNNGRFDMEILSSDYELEYLRAIGLHEVMDVAPIEKPEEQENTGGKMVCCPQCGEVFPKKGHGVKGE